MWACSVGKVDVVRLLLDHGADPLIRNKNGQNAIHLGRWSPEIRMILDGLILLSFHHHQHVP